MTIFALQTSGKYEGEPFLNSMLFIAVNGKPGDIIKLFSDQIGPQISFEEFMDKMDKFDPMMSGSDLTPLMNWYMSDHDGEDMVILSNGWFPGMASINDFDDWLGDQWMIPTGKITWFNPLLG